MHTFEKAPDSKKFISRGNSVNLSQRYYFLFQAMENHEEPSVLRVITDYDAQDHGLDVMRDALNYQVGIQSSIFPLHAEVFERRNTLLGKFVYCT